MDRLSRFRRHKKTAAAAAAAAATTAKSKDENRASTESATETRATAPSPAPQLTRPKTSAGLPVPTVISPATTPSIETGEDSRPLTSSSHAPSTSSSFLSANGGAPLPPLDPKTQQKMAGPLRSSRSPFRNLLRSSTKRARGSPSPATAVPAPVPALPRSPTTGLSSQMQGISLPANGAAVSPLRVARPEYRRSAQSASSTGKPSIPAFLNISYEEIESKFQDLVWMERERLQNSIAAPTGRWTRVTGPHLRLLDRYMNIQPWDKNRVKLKVPTGQIDYINASPIVLTTSAPTEATRPPDRYIAMQGPKVSSVDHVWRMVYEQMRSPAVIVMLTETHEGAHEKCYPYFPKSPDDPPMMINDHDEFGDGFHASVHCAEIEETAFGDAIELRRIMLRVHKKASPTSTLPAKKANAAASGQTAGNATKAKDKDAANGANGSAKKTRGPSPIAKATGLRKPAVKDEDGDSVMSEASAGSTSAPSTASGASSVPSETEEARAIDISQYEDERVVYHFLFKKWPDFGVPDIEDVDSFLGLMKLSAEKNADPNNPRIVHCSAGVGRSGTFIALEHLLRELDAGVLENYDASFVPGGEAEDEHMEGNDDHGGRGRIPMPQLQQHDSGSSASGGASMPDRTSIGSNLLGSESQSHFDAYDLIYTTVNQLREQRRTMVQAESQYHFIYQVLRKLWQEKYGIVETDNTQGQDQGQDQGQRQSQDSNGMYDGETSEASDGSEPAAKRLEVDPGTAK